MQNILRCRIAANYIQQLGRLTVIISRARGIAKGLSLSGFGCSESVSAGPKRVGNRPRNPRDYSNYRAPECHRHSIPLVSPTDINKMRAPSPAIARTLANNEKYIHDGLN